MEKRISIIFESDIYAQYGVFNSVRNRVLYLSKISDYVIDVYIVTKYLPWYLRLLRNINKQDRKKEIILDGITYHILWYRKSILEHIITEWFRLPPYFLNRFICRMAKKMRNYDFLSVHSGLAGKIAQKTKELYHIPYCITWHGSDIHTHPFQSKLAFAQTKLLLNNAYCNFFVSQALCDKATTITDSFRSEILYNGINSKFCCYSVEEKNKLRKTKGVPDGKKVVAFCGALLDVKNPLSLPPIFKSVMDNRENNLIFWIIGDGPLKPQVESEAESLHLPCVFWGNLPAEEMPVMMNCIDVLVLPSKKEGLPLVVIEALACGSNAVGSNVGGIKEAAGEDNVFDLDDSFVSQISTRINYLLHHTVEQPLNEVFDWKKTASKEKSVYDAI